MQIKLCTYNIHKGLSPFNVKSVMAGVKEFLISVDADIVCLQELIGTHSKFKSKFGDTFVERQLEYLADDVWKSSVYGKNALYEHGDHGNAILSKYTILDSENHNISLGKAEKRGLLYSRLELNDTASLHCFTTHLNLRSVDRKKQAAKIKSIVQDLVRNDDPVVISGDFNDWRSELSAYFKNELCMKDATRSADRYPLKTFPTVYPVLALDRIYYANMEIVECTLPLRAKKVLTSDHLPLLATFEV